MVQQRLTGEKKFLGIFQFVQSFSTFGFSYYLATNMRRLVGRAIEQIFSAGVTPWVEL